MPNSTASGSTAALMYNFYKNKQCAINCGKAATKFISTRAPLRNVIKLRNFTL